MKKVDFLAREIHHQKHARAIYDALPEKYRGVFTADPAELKSSIVATFSYGDLKKASALGKKVIYGEHGVGLYYNTEHASYAGSTKNRECVILRLSPNERHAKKERETLTCPVEVVGVPMMDKWANRNYRVKTYNPTVAISFHFDCLVCPETRSAFSYYQAALSRLAENFKVIGHGHPRMIEKLAYYYKRYGIQIEKDFDKVLQKADVYICDNSSTIFQFAFTKKPVVLLNCPYYRKNVEHEGNPRFWKHAGMGPQVDHFNDLVKSVRLALDSREAYRPKLEEAVADLFVYQDGKCAERAAQAIIKHI